MEETILKRHDWKNVHRFLKKCSFNEFKDFLMRLTNQTERDAYELAVKQGQEHIKMVMLGNIEEILNKEFSIGPKRFARFKVEFEKEFDLIPFSVQSQFTRDLPDDRRTTLQESTFLVIMMNIITHISEMVEADDDKHELFQDIDVKAALLKVQGELEKLYAIAKIKVNDDHFENVLEMASKKKLMLQALDWEPESGKTITYDLDQIYDLYEDFFNRTCGEKCTEHCPDSCTLRKKLIQHNIPIQDPYAKSGCEFK